MLKSFTDANFDREALQCAVPVFVMFSAPWAGPCNLVRPAFEALAAARWDDLDFGEFVVDDNPVIPERFGVRSLPAFLLLDMGKPVVAMTGAVTAADLADTLTVLD